VIYLDTGCLVKLYYPEPDSQKVAALIAGKVICFNPLHELEFTNALHLKIFHRGATTTQVQAAVALVEADVKSGVLFASVANWERTFRAATEARPATLGVPWLPIPGCAALRGVPSSGSMRISHHGRRTEAVGRCNGPGIGNFLNAMEEQVAVESTCPSVSSRAK
jgi:hypothetical protein